MLKQKYSSILLVVLLLSFAAIHAHAAEPGRGDTWTDPVTGMVFVRVPGGCFQMGQTPYEGRRLVREMGQDTYDTFCRDSLPLHPVCVDGFWMGKYEVTQAQWRALMGGDPSSFKGDRNPVDSVSWDDAQEFIRALNGRGNGTFRLPTEAEWEFAARGGARDDTVYPGGDVADSVAWYSANSGGKTHPAGGKAPNRLGLHDMSGNVWEWCQDLYGKHSYSESPRDNPRGPSTGDSGRVARGGAWNCEAGGVFTVGRIFFDPGAAYDILGFRLVRIK